jgi:ligand-binding sensor domain-containing protein/serine phosphatase RsbU (regulator of sigma subunit)
LKHFFYIGLLIFLFGCGDHEQASFSYVQFDPEIVKANPKIVQGNKPIVVHVGEPVVTKAGNPDLTPVNQNISDAPKLPVFDIQTSVDLARVTMTPDKMERAQPANVYRVKDSVFVAGHPEMVVVKDAYTKDVNPANFSSFNKLQGLKHGNVNCIAEDKHGNLWFGTDGGGISRYDGKWFTHFTEQEGLVNNVVRSMLHDERGRLWIGTDGGITLFDGKYFTNYSKKNGLPAEIIYSIAQDDKNQIWFGTEKGMLVYNGKSFLHYNQQSGFTNARVWTILNDRRKGLWIGTDSGLFSYSGIQFKQHISAINRTLDYNPTPAIRCLIQDRNGYLWGGTNGNGVFRFDGTTFYAFTQENGLASNKVLCMIMDKGGDLWFGTDGMGLTRYNGKSLIQYNKQEGLTNDVVLTAMQDHGGNLWFGTYGGGVVKYNGKLFTHITQSEGLSDNVVRGILKDSEGNLWFGTNGGGVVKYDGVNFANYSLKQGLSNDVVRCLVQDNDGNIWMGTHDGGVIKFDGKNFSTYSKAQGLPHNTVRSILNDSKGRLWFGTGGAGVCCYNGRTFATYGIKQGLGNGVILALCEDKEGNIWMGTEGDGIYVYDGKKIVHYNRKNGLNNDFVFAIYCDKKNNIWIGTGGGGLTLYNNRSQGFSGRGKTFTHFTEREGLSNNFVFAILQDNEENYWFGTRFGLNKITASRFNDLEELLADTIAQPDSVFNTYKRGEVFFKTYGYEDGFLGIGCYANSICEDNSGNIWIGSNDRLTIYNPKGDETDSRAPDIQLNDIELFNENISWINLFDHKRGKVKDTSFVLGNGVNVSNFNFNSINNNYGIPDSLDLAYDNNFLTFKFIGISQRQPARVKYQYKLDGFDKNWSALVLRTEAPYGNLPPGKYIFKVRAMNSEGYWSNEIDYPFSIRPPWWRTTWFTVTLVAGIVLVLYLAYSLRIRTLRVRQRRLEQTVASRTTEVVLQKEEAEKQKRLAEAQKELVILKQQEITDSINYAKHIQEAILPPMSLVKAWVPDCFILYKPKDIIAGDFYFFEKNETHIFYAAADCTGHGVPGALVSIVCSNALSRSIKEFNLVEPGQILDKTRELVMESLNKSYDDVNDGMDISLICFERNTVNSNYPKTIKWAGANNPLWIYENVIGSIREIKGDKQPIGKTYKPKPFKTHTVNVNKRDVLFMFTDGYADQFGLSAEGWSKVGSATVKGRKFKYSNLERLLGQIGNTSMTEQRSRLNTEFEAWRGNLEQIDDVCIMGIRF